MQKIARIVCVAKCIVFTFDNKKTFLKISLREREGEREGELGHIVCLEVSVVVDMASVGVPSHQGRAYGAQPHPTEYFATNFGCSVWQVLIFSF